MTEGSDTNTEEAAAKQSPVDAQCQQPINKDEIENASKNDYDNYLVIIMYLYLYIPFLVARMLVDSSNFRYPYQDYQLSSNDLCGDDNGYCQIL